MVRRAIRNFHSDCPKPPRLFDVVVDNKDVSIEIKTDKNKIEKIPWPEVLLQVEAAIQSSTIKQ